MNILWIRNWGTLVHVCWAGAFCAVTRWHTFGHKSWVELSGGWPVGVTGKYIVVTAVVGRSISQCAVQMH